MEKNRHYAYDLEFQKYLLASFLSDEKYLRDNYEIFREEFFGDDILQGISRTIRTFFKDHSEIPSKEALLQELKINLASGRKYTEYEEAVEEIFERIGVNSSYFQEKAVKFAQVHIWDNAIKSAFILIEQGEVEEASQTMMEAQKQAELAQKNGFYDYFKSVADRALEYFEQREGKGNMKRVPTGFPPLDERIQGGLGSGETGVIIAPPKHGKTTTLVSMAVQSLIREKRALYVTLELGKDVIATKFDSHLTGNDLSILRKKPKSYQDEMEKIMQRIKGRLTIVEFPTKTLSLSKLNSTLSQIKPDVMFLDYAALLRPGKDRDQRRFEISDAHEGLRALAGENKIPIWTAHQSNRPGLGAKVLDMEHIAEDFNVGAIADVVISINQSPDERRRGTLRFYIVANRLGSSKEEIACKVDWKISRITPASEEV